jgi:hypothetical protein
MCPHLDEPILMKIETECDDVIPVSDVASKRLASNRTPLAARIALNHYANLLKIMAFSSLSDAACSHYLRNYQKDFIEAGEQNPPLTKKITIRWMEEQWPI